MKKTYINPSTDVVTLNVENMMAISGPDTLDKSADQQYGMDVKGDRFSRDNYNVWNDDWSQ